MARQLHRAHDERVRPSGRERDHERLAVDPPEPAERLLRRARDELGAQVEQHQQVAQVAGEERHLVGPRDHDPLGRRRSRRSPARSVARLALRALSSTFAWSAAIAVSNSVRSIENSGEEASGGAAWARLYSSRAAALQLGEALEAERLREAHDGRARGVRAARELLRGLERGLVEVIDDVLRDVLLRARALVEARLDVARERLRLARRCRRRAGDLRAALFISDVVIRRSVSHFLQRWTLIRGPGVHVTTLRTRWFAALPTPLLDDRPR